MKKILPAFILRLPAFLRNFCTSFFRGIKSLISSCLNTYMRGLSKAHETHKTDKGLSPWRINLQKSKLLNSRRPFPSLIRMVMVSIDEGDFVGCTVDKWRPLWQEQKTFRLRRNEYRFYERPKRSHSMDRNDDSSPTTTRTRHLESFIVCMRLVRAKYSIGGWWKSWWMALNRQRASL